MSPAATNTFKRARADRDMSFWGVTRVIFVFKFYFLFDTAGYCWIIFCYRGGNFPRDGGMREGGMTHEGTPGSALS